MQVYDNGDTLFFELRNIREILPLTYFKHHLIPVEGPIN